MLKYNKKYHSDNHIVVLKHRVSLLRLWFKLKYFKQWFPWNYEWLYSDKIVPFVLFEVLLRLSAAIIILATRTIMSQWFRSDHWITAWLAAICWADESNAFWPISYGESIAWRVVYKAAPKFCLIEFVIQPNRIFRQYKDASVAESHFYYQNKIAWFLLSGTLSRP